MREEAVTFKSEGLRLEGLFHKPNTAAPARAAVVCHPHPLYGGSMLDVVVQAILAAMWSLDYATLRFNFRGVGRSEGEHDNGYGEVLDAQSAVKWMAGSAGIQRDRLILAGYSFGAIVAVNAGVKLSEVDPVVAVAPPIVTDGIREISAMKKRLVVVAGEEDRYCPASQLEVLRNALLGLMRLKVIPDADHFFAGQEDEVTAALTEMCRGA
jgi:alpha/beta superfamily hydrolase